MGCKFLDSSIGSIVANVGGNDVSFSKVVDSNGNVLWSKKSDFLGLKFTAVSPNSKISLDKYGNPYGITIMVSKNGGRFESYAIGSKITLANVGDYVCFSSGDGGNANFSKGEFDYYYFSIEGYVTASGNVMSILDETMERRSVSDWAFRTLFCECETLLSPPELPATELSSHCYSYMFVGCIALTAAPELPAESMSKYCYEAMFRDCSALTSATELTSTSLEEGCYDGMFWGCTALSSAPELNASELKDYCYRMMFRECTSLKSAPSLIASELKTACYMSMFYGCTSLKTAPVLKATNIPNSAYSYMFYGCNSLEEVSTNQSNFDGCYIWLPSTNGTFYCTKALKEFIDSKPSSYRTNSTVPSTWNIVATDYLTFTAESDNSSMTVGYTSGTNVQYSKNGGKWESCPNGTKIRLDRTGESVRLRGNNVTTDHLKHFAMTGRISADGSVTSLTDGYGANSGVTLGYACYFSMFSGCNSLVKAPKLIATNLSEYCYSTMFEGCIALSSAPDLPAENIEGYCYISMFSGCTSLTSAPELKAATLKEWCYTSMFSGCTSLTSTPVLSSTQLTEYCYKAMFKGCSNIISVTELPASDMRFQCYHSMFSGCTSLTSAPSLTSANLDDSCYSYMFSDCTSLVEAPELPSKNLSIACYRSMFSGCTSLTSAPSLTSTNLVYCCYEYMFSGCTSLADFGELPAETMRSNCYANMFSGCTSLTSIHTRQDDFSLNSCTNWLPETEGTFYCMSWLKRNIESQPQSFRTKSTVPLTWTLKTYE